MLHGIMGSKDDMVDVEAWIKEDFPGIHVLNAEVGDGFYDSVFMNMNQQVDEFAKAVKADPALKGGFNLIGML